jgi:hypothetical protein
VKNYAGKGPQHLFDVQVAGHPFETLTSSDHDALVALLDVGRNPDFASNVDASPLYYLAELTRGQVAMLWALPTFGPPPHHPAIPFMDFFLDTFGAANVSDDADPRKMSTRSFVSDHEPVIVMRSSHRQFLLEGYGRTVTFMRDTDNSQRLRAWCPLVATMSE